MMLHTKRTDWPGVEQGQWAGSGEPKRLSLTIWAHFQSVRWIFMHDVAVRCMGGSVYHGGEMCVWRNVSYGQWQ